MSSRNILHYDFFHRPVLTVAEELIGKTIVRRNGEHELCGLITEVEAYDGENDKACHAHHGRTGRTEVMYGPAGHWYVYFCYGMHWMLNVITGPIGYPAGVLIRGVEDVDGPARVAKHFGIDAKFNGQKAQPESGLWIEDNGIAFPKHRIKRTPRIGIDYAEEWVEKPYRFVVDKL